MILGRGFAQIPSYLLDILLKKKHATKKLSCVTFKVNCSALGWGALLLWIAMKWFSRTVFAFYLFHFLTCLVWYHWRINIANSQFPDLLFSKFRLGWKMSVDAIPLKSSGKPSLQTFMVVVEKELSTLVHQITSLLHNSSLHCNSKQVDYLGYLYFLFSSRGHRSFLKIRIYGWLMLHLLVV